MPSFSPRTLCVSLVSIALILLTALTLTPRLDLDTLSIPSPFAQHSKPPPCPCAQQQASLSDKNQQQPTWLLATISSYSSQRRRNIIRATWQTLYPNPAFDTRFVIAQPSPLWQPLIEHENATYGDIIILKDLEESAKVANTIKTVEFFKHLVSNSRDAHPPPWQFVSKIDDDGFLSAERFYQEFLVPRLHDAPATTNGHQAASDNKNGTLIARRLIRAERPFDTPGGQFYTLSWNLLPLIASTHTRNPISDLAEDHLTGRLLYEARAKFEFVELDERRAFDISEDGTGRLGLDHKELGKIDEGAINPHKMKDDEMYLKVAGMFGKEGFVGEGG